METKKEEQFERFMSVMNAFAKNANPYETLTMVIRTNKNLDFIVIQELRAEKEVLFKMSNRQVLHDIELHAYLECYFDVKMGHVDDWEYCQEQMLLNGNKREKLEKRAREIGISEEEIKSAVNKGIAKVDEIIEECESIGWE